MGRVVDTRVSRAVVATPPGQGHFNCVNLGPPLSTMLLLTANSPLRYGSHRCGCIHRVQVDGATMLVTGQSSLEPPYWRWRSRQEVVLLPTAQRQQNVDSPRTLPTESPSRKQGGGGFGAGVRQTIYRWYGPHIQMGGQNLPTHSQMGEAPIYRWGMSIETHIQMGRHPYTDGA
jgi:hypothetical protein